MEGVADPRGTEPADAALWRRIAACDLDALSQELTFTERLARENGWSRCFARRAVEEYRRFAYLAATADHEVTPSDEVDQVWHLHLAYTRHYWGPWAEALGRPLHHGPTAGGTEAATRYRTAYERTLESYHRAFGEEPPEDIWPDPSPRFSRATAMQRVDRRRYLLVSKPSIRRTAWIAVPVFVALAAMGGDAGAPGRWAAGTRVGGWFADEPALAYPVVFLFGAPLLLAAAAGLAGTLLRAVRGPRRRRRADGTWSFAWGDGDGDSGCSGCGD